MSEDNRPPQPKIDGYFPVEWVSLREGTTLTFDCHIYLPRNEKVVRWLRAGSVFGPLHAKKLEQLGHPQILVLQDQVENYESYIGVKGKTGRSVAVAAQEKESHGQTIRIFGSSITKDENEMIVIKDTYKKEGQPLPPKPPPRMQVDVDFINAVVASIQSVFSSICGVKLTFQAPKQRKENSAPPFAVNLASFVNLNSQTIRGTVGLCFPALTYLNLLSAATGLSFHQLSDNLTLGAGEFMYHIFETARPSLEAIGYNIDRAVPFLVSGKDVSIRHVLPEQGFSLLFNSPMGQFQFEVGIKTGR